MKVEVKSDNKAQVKPGSIVALESDVFNNWTDITEYYLVIYNDRRYSLVNIKNGEMFINSYSSTDSINDFIKEEAGKVYSIGL